MVVRAALVGPKLLAARAASGRTSMLLLSASISLSQGPVPVFSQIRFLFRLLGQTRII